MALPARFTYDALSRLKTTEGFLSGNNAQLRTTYDYHYRANSGDHNYIATSVWAADLPSGALVSKQFADGLGRPIGAIKEGYTPSGQHLKAFTEYDALGRQHKSYHPFESAVTGFQTAPWGTPVSQTFYETSPLSRPIRSVQADGSTVLNAYGANTDADAVKRYQLQNRAVSELANYDAGQLFKTTVTDENGKQTIVFKDKLGRVVLTRKVSATLGNADTYNVYDANGNLAAVVPPLNAGEDANALSFKYLYNEKNQLAEKKIPDVDWQKFYYDDRGLLVLTQDGKMRQENTSKYLYTQYDELNCPIQIGFAYVSDPESETANHQRNIAYLLSETTYETGKNRILQTKVRILGTNEFLTTQNSYDTYGRLITTQANNHVGGTETTNLVHHFFGKPQSAAHEHNAFGTTVNVNQDFEYDHSLRAKQTWQEATIDGNHLGGRFLLADLEYSFKDQVIRKNLANHGSRFLQNIDYTYNVRGWLTAINPVPQTTISTGGGGATSMKLLKFSDPLVEAEAEALQV
jgi:Domain of unknown function (DUF6443)